MVHATVVPFADFLDQARPSQDRKYEALLDYMLAFAATQPARVPHKILLCRTLVGLPPRFTDLCDGLLHLGGYARTLPDITRIIDVMNCAKK